MMKDFIIPKGSFVRYILPRRDGFKKKLYNLSPEKYLISGVEGNLYILMAHDGKIMLKPRFLLRVCSQHENKQMKIDSTIPGTSRGKIKRIDENIGRKHVRVVFELPDGGESVDIISKTFFKK